MARWPEWALAHPQARAYPSGHREEIKGKPCGDLYAAYAAHLAPNVSRNWRQVVLGFLRELQAFGAERGDPDLARIRPSPAQEWINRIPESPGPFQKNRGNRTASTANRALAAASGFYGWAVRLGYVVSNPFAGIPVLPEPDREIVYLTLEERNEVLAAAADDPEGISVWLALYAGRRRSEIARLAWEQVNLQNRKLDVIGHKTPRRKRAEARRTIDIAEGLLRRLEKTAPAKRRGRIVPWPDGELEWQHRADLLIARLRAGLHNQAEKRIARADLKGKRAAEARSWIRKVSWNNFRHTFCTLHAQAGVPPFTIIGWSGHSMEIFLRHYAAHMPNYDDRIDRRPGGARVPVPGRLGEGWRGGSSLP